MRSLRGRFNRRTVAAIVFSTTAATAAMILAVGERSASRTASRPTVVRPLSVDPLAAEFAHCQALGDGGAHDPGCLAAWAESRRRFLTPDRRPIALVASSPGGR